MAKATFQIRVTRRVTISPVGFSADQMNVIGLATVESIKRRWAKGLDVNDRPTAPLALAYARRKQRRGLSILPNLRFTGELYRSFGVRVIAPGECRIGFGDPRSIIKAYVNQQRRRQIGISEADAGAVRPLAIAILRENIRGAVRSVAA